MLPWNRKMFPGTNLQDLNLDWILRKVAALRGGSTGQYLYKKSEKDFDFGWKTGGGGGTSDYLDLDNKPSINSVELIGNKNAADLGLAAASDIPTVLVQSVNGKTGAVELTASDLGAYVKPAAGIPETDLSSSVQAGLSKANTALQAVPPTYRTAAAQDVIDAAQDAQIDASAKANEIAIVITGARPSNTVTAGQYVIVRNSTISGVTDGLYTANSALSPSTDVTMANLTSVSGGGLNCFTGNPTNTYLTASVTTGEKISNLRTAIATVRGGLCQLYIGFDIGQAIATNELMFVLPEGFRPKTSADGLLVVTTNNGVSRTVRMNESGNITAAEPFTVANYNRLVGMYFI